jgi:phage shock protein PspC (stress-responsive transcriptional regulator)
MRCVTTRTPAPRQPASLSRAARGRWVGGVCAGLARLRGLPVASLRLVFVAAALVGGLGILVYLACWIIIPAEGDEGARGPREIVALAKACACGVGLASLGALAAAGTVFGFGWAVLVLAAVVLVASLVCWPRVGAAWTLLPVAALALPAVALAAGGVHLATQMGDTAVAPRTLADVPRAGYRSGLGTLLVDLRRTTLPAAGETPLRIDAGVGRTIVALPHDRCVHVDVRYRVQDFAARAASLLSGRPLPDRVVAVFGRQQYGGTGELAAGDERTTGPTLAIDFTSAGGGLYVRDYPDDTDPRVSPDWPGFEVTPEERPDVTGLRRKAARRLVRAWRERRDAQVRDARRVAVLMYGPCSARRGVRR